MLSDKYYKKYLKYKQKYLQYKSIKYNLLGGNRTIKKEKVSSIFNTNTVIKFKPFNVNELNIVLEHINEIIPSSLIGFPNEQLYFVTDSDNVVGIVAMEGGNIIKLDLSQSALITNNIIDFLKNNKLTEDNVFDDVIKNPDKVPERIYKYVMDKISNNMSLTDNNGEIDIKVKQNLAMEFILTNRATNDLNKTIIYYAIRHGKYDLLNTIKNMVGEENFKILMTVVDDLGRTPFMVSTHSQGLNPDGSQNKIFDFILENTPGEILHAFDYGLSNFDSEPKYSYKHLNALGWFNLRHVENKYIESKLRNLFGDVEFK